MSEVHEGTPLDPASAETTRPAKLELWFEIRFETGEGEQMAIPCGDPEEVELMLGRLRRACEQGGVEPPALEVWRLERRAARASSESEPEEAGSAALEPHKGPVGPGALSSN